MRSRRALWCRDEGAAAVETALVLVLLFPFMIGMVEFARAYWNWNSLMLAVAEAGRYAMVNSNNSSLAACTATTFTNDCASVRPATLPNCTAYQTNQNLIGSVSNVSIALSCVASSPTTMTITATYNFDFVASTLLPYGPIALTGRAKVPLM